MKNGGKHNRVIASRLIVAILGSIGCTLLFVLRSNLSVAIIAMVDEKELIEDNNQTQGSDLCYDINKLVNQSHSKPGYKGKFRWSQSVQGTILGSYFYGFCATQFMGYFADRFGAKWIIGFGVFIPAVFNALIPVLAHIHYALIIAMRVSMGAFHGMVLACLFSMISKWFPHSEQNLALTALMFSGNLGGVITMPLTGYLCKTDLMGGWPSVFYLTSILHLIWFYFWYEYVYNCPEEDLHITQSELEYILNNNKNSKNVRNLSIPWKAMFKSRAIYSSFISKTCSCFSYHMLCAKMPTYLDTVFGLEIHTNSWFISLMYAVFCCSSVSAGPLSNWIKTKKWISLTRNRKNFQSFSNFGICICLALIPSAECDSKAAVFLLLLGMFLFGGISGGEFAIIPEYAPNYSGTVFGMANTMASTTGFIGPQLVGYLLDHGDGSGVRHQWNKIWYIAAAINCVGGLSFEVLATADPQPWAVINKTPFVVESKHLKEQRV